jgi:quercetin dioxygenase-like cupin family protein
VSAIKFVRAEQLDFIKAGDLVTTEAPLQARAADPTAHSEVSESTREGMSVRMYFPGGTDELQLFEARADAGLVVEPHAHSEDEIIFVLEGELSFGSQVYPAGSSAYIPNHTLYGFRAGPVGARFLNFRRVADYSFISPTEYLQSRRNLTIADGNETGVSEK